MTVKDPVSSSSTSSNTPSKPPRAVGRRLKLNDNLILQAEQLAEKGLTDKAIQGILKIGNTTYYRWLQEGEKAPPGTPHREFRERLARAHARAEEAAVGVLQDAMRGEGLFAASPERGADGRAALEAAKFLLERRNPAGWGRKHQVELEGKRDGAPIILRMWQSEDEQPKRKAKTESDG